MPALNSGDALERVDEAEELARRVRKKDPAAFAQFYAANIGRFLSVAPLAAVQEFANQLRRSALNNPALARVFSQLAERVADRTLDEQVALKARLRLQEELNYSKQTIYLNVDSPQELKQAREFDKKEVETVEWIENFTKRDVFYDVGANIGLFTLLAAAQPEKKHTVVAFEPAVTSFHSLCSSLRLNGLTERTIPIQTALSDRTGVDQFNYWSLNPGTAKSVVGPAVDWRGTDFKPQAVLKLLTITLDDAIRTFDLPFPNHLKIDVDGIEMKVLSGAAKTLRDSRLRSVMVEAGGPEMERNLEQLFSTYGFRLSRRQAKEIQTDTTPKTRNNYFERK